jgi:hypothetical protein
MATIKQGILGGFSGKIGGIVGSSWKGINVMKARPVSVANPKTAGQVAQREKFSNVVAFAVTMLATIIKPLWDRFASQMSGFNAFVSENLSEFAAALPATYANLVISTGKMAETVIDSVTGADGDATVTVAWTDDSGTGYKLADDEAYCVVINEDNEDWAVSSAVADRDDGTLDVELPSVANTGDSLHAYLAFRRDDGTIASDTGYKTEDV